MQLIVWFQDTGMNDVENVGGKNASLGEMISQLANSGVEVPGGFATTSAAFRDFLAQDNLAGRIYDTLNSLDVNDITALQTAGRNIRQWIIETPFSSIFEDGVTTAYEQLRDGQDISVAVRSSATAEDLPDASFAGQQETLLNVNDLADVFIAIKEVYASLFTDRAITYRQHHGFAHDQVALSAGIQLMVRSDLATSGVAFSIDTESGFDKVVFITAAYGLGETVVQGLVNPDEYYVYKPNLEKNIPAILRRNLGSKHKRMVYANEGVDDSERVKIIDVSLAEQQQFCLNDEEIEQLAQQVLIIEKHYGRPMDVEWAKDGNNGKIYIVQARPETVKSRDQQQVIERYQLQSEPQSTLITGRSIGQRIGSGTAKIIENVAHMDDLNDGDILVTDMTDPDWEPVMKRASAIVTNRGGRTCHAAIIARELGIPAVVGTNTATQAIMDGQHVTVSCAEGDTGFIYDGLIDFQINRIEVNNMPEIPFKVSMNVGNPDRAFAFQALPHAGVGLARLEFIINHMIGVHPKALLEFDKLSPELAAQITPRMAAYGDPKEFYIEKLREGIATIAAAFNPEPVIVRLSDFKSNEYANLIGGSNYEPTEENPMLGFRGASRYVSESFRDCFELECEALKRIRNDNGLKNVEIMVPFVRTVAEAKRVIEILAENGLRRGEDGLRIIMMCELPSNALLADEFLEHFDGFSIGSNDLTQLTLGLDRDSGLVAEQFDECDEAVKILFSKAISACNKAGKYIGICGQGPSDHPDLAQWLMAQGISAVSLNPDTVVETWMFLAKNSG